MSNDALKKTPFHAQHVAAGARMVDFGGWDMPVQYPAGIISEHLATRSNAGLFDVSHMGRFIISGPDALPFLQHVLTNNAAALDLMQAQYTIIPNENGGAVDDAYLYRFCEDEYLLVVNASNLEKDWAHFQTFLPQFPGVKLVDVSPDVAMMALQGPKVREILESLVTEGEMPEPMRNELSIVKIGDATVQLARTGYTGEPICFEVLTDVANGPAIWDAIIAAGASPVGLGARDTLRLEAALPLYGHEFGVDSGGVEIPILSCPLAVFGVSFSPLKGDYVGREALKKQHDAYSRIIDRDYSLIDDLPYRTQPVAITGRGIARQGAPVYKDGEQVGWISSGTMVPFWDVDGDGLFAKQTDEHEMRSIALAYLSSKVLSDAEVEVEVRGKSMPARVVDYHLRSDAPPYSRSIIWDHKPELPELPTGTIPERAARLISGAIDNHVWRQEQCIDLIPSEMTSSSLSRLLSITDPSGRYAEHKKAQAFYDLEVFYYQGTKFIDGVERMLIDELRTYFGCREVETRAISGQMANTAVFGAMVDFINRSDRKAEPRRMRKVVNNHIAKGGHLSAQPMGALRDFVAREPRTEMPAVEDIPVLPDNPYKVDVPALLELIERERPELIILGKSMVLHPEPVREVRQLLDDTGIDAVLMYDMAHVLGLVGPHFQDPFSEGADVVTGSSHKTFFGTQRGIIAGNWQEGDLKWDLWEAIERRAFPGSTSNHHLGTMLGLLMSAYEMNHFKDEYQKAVVTNAKSFAKSLKAAGLDVAGDPANDYTETHQVVVHVGYSQGAEVAERLEENGIICNYQAVADEEGFTASGALRLGVSEMTRYGMGADDFAKVAELMAAVILEGRNVADEVTEFRAQFTKLGYTFDGGEFDPLVERLRELV